MSGLDFKEHDFLAGSDARFSGASSGDVGGILNHRLVGLEGSPLVGLGLWDIV